jgi:hypothetical protein
VIHPGTSGGQPVSRTREIVLSYHYARLKFLAGVFVESEIRAEQVVCRRMMLHHQDVINRMMDLEEWVGKQPEKKPDEEKRPFSELERTAFRGPEFEERFG